MPRCWLRLFILVPVVSCGGGDGDGGPSPAITVIAKAGAPNGDGQSGTVARALADSFRVVVTEGGVARSGVTVNWTTSAAGALLTPAASVTDANGRAASLMTLGQGAGSQAVRASLSAGSFVLFSASANPGPPTQIVAISGNDQAGLANTGLTQPLRVQVSDQFDNFINGSPVSWSVISGPANLSGSTSLTSGAGIASISMTTGGSAGAIQVAAVSAGPDTVIFTAHVVTLVKEVLVKNNFFESVANGSKAPAVDTIPAGEAVRWVWQSAQVGHNIIPQGSPLFQGVSGSIRSPFIHGPVRIAAPGTYNYDCNLHTGMSGVIVVQ